MNEAARILNAAVRGDPKAAEELLPLVYEELRKLAMHKLSTQKPGTLQATALVHEAWIRLVGDEPPEFDSRGHFFAAAAEAMRRILIDRAREREALKRGGNLERVDLEHVDLAADTSDDTMLAVNEALEKFSHEHPDAAQFIKLRFFAGLTNEEAALVVGVPERTARRHWTFAKAWLYREMQRQAKS